MTPASLFLAGVITVFWPIPLFKEGTEEWSSPLRKT
jgi:hypothetical protein